MGFMTISRIKIKTNATHVVCSARSTGTCTIAGGDRKSFAVKHILIINGLLTFLALLAFSKREKTA